MSGGVSTLIALANNERQKREKLEEKSFLDETQAQIDAMRDLFSAQVWGFLGADPGQATRESKNHNAALRFTVNVEGWPIELQIRYSQPCFMLDVICGKESQYHYQLVSSTQHQHSNAVSVGYALESGLKWARVNQRSQIDQWVSRRPRLTASDAEYEKWAAELGAIPNLSEAELIAKQNYAKSYYNDMVSCRAEKNKKRLKDLADARRLKKLAAEYEQMLAQYRVACHDWALQETAKLWQAWVLLRVTYVPVRVVRGADDQENELFQTVYTTSSPMQFAKECPALVNSIGRDGEITEKMYIGAFVNATPITFEKPVIHERVPYHRTYEASGYYVNVPAGVKDEPEPAPDPCQVVSFAEYASQKGFKRAILSTALGIAVAEMKPEEIVSKVLL